MREFFNLVVIALTRLPAACTKIRKLIIRASPAALCAAGCVFQDFASAAFQRLQFLDGFLFYECLDKSLQ